jgi:two-component system, chemotaxis family, chemotaxis protein CheY
LSAKDGADALQLLHSGVQAPDLIFLDLRMPIMNGWQFHEEQVRYPAFARIPTIIITADGAAIAANDFCWAQGLVTKPFHFDQIVDFVSHFLKPLPEAGVGPAAVTPPA